MRSSPFRSSFPRTDQAEEKSGGRQGRDRLKKRQGDFPFSFSKLQACSRSKLPGSGQKENSSTPQPLQNLYRVKGVIAVLHLIPRGFMHIRLCWKKTKSGWQSNVPSIPSFLRNLPKGKRPNSSGLDVLTAASPPT